MPINSQHYREHLERCGKLQRRKPAELDPAQLPVGPHMYSAYEGSMGNGMMVPSATEQRIIYLHRDLLRIEKAINQRLDRIEHRSPLEHCIHAMFAMLEDIQRKIPNDP